MNPIKHHACNATLGPPPGMTEEQVRTLHIFRESEPGQPPYVSSFWVPEPQELHALNEGGAIWFRMMGHTHPPMSMLVTPAADAAGAIETNPPADGTNPPPAFVLTSEHFLSLVKERDELLAWRNHEFDSGDDSAFNVRRLRAYLKRWQSLEDVHTNVVPGDGNGEELPATPESIRAHIKHLQDEWDAAERTITTMSKDQEIQTWHKEFNRRFLSMLFNESLEGSDLTTIREIVARMLPDAAPSENADIAEWARNLRTQGPQSIGEPDIPIGVCEPLPLSGFPAGKIRVRMSPDDPVNVYVKTADGIRKFIPVARNGQWLPWAEIGRTIRPHGNDSSSDS